MATWRRYSVLLKTYTIFRLRFVLVAILAGIATTYFSGWYFGVRSYRSTAPSSSLFNARWHTVSVMTDDVSGGLWLVNYWRTKNQLVSAMSWHDISYDAGGAGKFGRYLANWNYLPHGMKDLVRKGVLRSDSDRVYFTVTTGWPYRSLIGSYSSVRFMYDSEQFYHSVLVSRDPSSKYHLILPLKPIMPGFIANAVIFTVFYYLAIVLAGHLRFALVRRRRRRKACCVVCGYMVLDLPTCPECGQPVATKA